MSDNEGQYFLIPTDDVCEVIDPYVAALKPYGIDRRRIIEYALRAHAAGDYAQCRDRIESDLQELVAVGAVRNLLDYEKAVDIVMDAVGDALPSLTESVVLSMGMTQTGTKLIGFVADAPVISPIKVDE